MCAEDLTERHSHVVNLHGRTLMCTCRACYLLFTHQGAGQGHYRAVPERYRHDPGFALTAAQWEALQIPVRMAFFFANSTLGKVVGFYPSPAGATECLLPLEAWDEVMAVNPAFGDLQPDVEALLIVRRGDDGLTADGYLAPIDACYELVGRVKRSWKGFDGGQEVWAEIDDFFARLRRRSEAVAQAPPP